MMMNKLKKSHIVIGALLKFIHAKQEGYWFNIKILDIAGDVTRYHMTSSEGANYHHETYTAILFASYSRDIFILQSPVKPFKMTIEDELFVL